MTEHEHTHTTRNPDVAIPRPLIELDEGSGESLLKASTQAIHTFADVMINLADAIRRGEVDGLMKVGFDFKQGAYIEMDLRAMLYHLLDAAPEEVSHIVEEMRPAFGRYVPGPHGVDRPVYAQTDPDTVRLFMLPTGTDRQ